VSDEQSPLSRWSQRKLAARRGGVVEDETLSEEAQIPSAPEPQEVPQQSADAPPPADAPALPSIDELGAQSDYTVFMGKNVPEALKRAALRKLWTSIPLFGIRDGLDVYDEDYNLIDEAIALVQTGYKAGRGYLEEIEDKLEQFDDVAVGDGSNAPPESEVAPNSPDSQAGGTGSLGNSDASGEELSDAPRQLAAAEHDNATTGSPEDADK
jgi:hypothetical protein